MMKQRIVGLAFIALVGCMFAQPSMASPVDFVADKTATIAHRAAYRIDKHVVRPARRVFARNTRR